MGDTNKNILLSSAYLAPIQYFTKLVSYEVAYLEHCESYLKQTYRNRTVILAANGAIQLSLPVADGPKAKGPIKDIRLSYDHRWQQIYWRSISSAYNNSPFFEYYANDLAPFFHEKKWKFLIDFNSEIQDSIIGAIGIKVEIKPTEGYYPVGNVPGIFDDFRHAIHPKPQKQVADPHFIPTPYTQVFHEKFGFVPNLSIIDLLFNEGPSTAALLRSCVLK